VRTREADEARDIAEDPAVGSQRETRRDRRRRNPSIPGVILRMDGVPCGISASPTPTAGASRGGSVHGGVVTSEAMVGSTSRSLPLWPAPQLRCRHPLADECRRCVGAGDVEQVDVVSDVVAHLK